MKRFITVLMMLLVGCSAFAYEGYRFNKDGTYPKGTVYRLGDGQCGYKWLLQDHGYDISKMTEVLMDNDAYCMLYNMQEGNGAQWAIVETKEYVGVTSTNGYWREYHLYRK